MNARRWRNLLTLVLLLIPVGLAGQTEAPTVEPVRAAVEHFNDAVLGQDRIIGIDAEAQHWRWAERRAATEGSARMHCAIAQRLGLRPVALSSVLRCEEEPSWGDRYARCRLEGFDAVVRILVTELDGDRGRVTVMHWANMPPSGTREEWLITAVTGFVDVEWSGGRWQVRDMSIMH